MNNDFITALQKELDTINNRNKRSAWDRGIAVYTDDLMESLKEAVEYHVLTPANSNELKAWLLNGASSWIQYSYGGSSLIYDYEIAKRLCNPTELKQTKGGERNPNSRETWLDVQARALKQASLRIASAYANYKFKEAKA